MRYVTVGVISWKWVMVFSNMHGPRVSLRSTEEDGEGENEKMRRKGEGSSQGETWGMTLETLKKTNTWVGLSNAYNLNDIECQSAEITMDSKCGQWKMEDGETKDINWISRISQLPLSWDIWPTASIITNMPPSLPSLLLDTGKTNQENQVPAGGPLRLTAQPGSDEVSSWMAIYCHNFHTVAIPAPCSTVSSHNQGFPYSRNGVAKAYLDGLWLFPSIF